MGYEPRAAERLRRAVAAGRGALDDIAHLIAEPGEKGEEGEDQEEPVAAGTAADPTRNTR